MYIIVACGDSLYILLTCLRVSAATQACGVPGGQSVGLWWSPAEGLVRPHIYTDAGLFLTELRLENVYVVGGDVGRSELEIDIDM